MACGCNGSRSNQASATPEQLVAAAQQRADERRAEQVEARLAELQSQVHAVQNAGSGQ